MKIFGNVDTFEIVSLVKVSPRGFEDNLDYHPEQLCPIGKYWRSHPDAPWNALESDSDPSNYLDEDGEPLFWETPTLIPFIKLSKPKDEPGFKWEPKLVWFNDRVERDWDKVALNEQEIAIQNRKIWPNTSLFLNEFTLDEIASVSTSVHPVVAGLRLVLASWPGEVWSDDPRIQMGLSAILEAGIVTEERLAEITAK